MILKTVKNIGIAGAGGIGSNLLAFLFDYGYNRKQFDYSEINVDIYDDDTVDASNLLHQNFKFDDIGKHKVSVMEDRYVVNGIRRYMTEKDLKKYDVVFSCVDSMTFRKMLYNYGWQAGSGKLFWIDGRCSSRQGALFTSEHTRESLEQFIDDSTESGSCLLEYEKEQNISHAMPIIVAGLMLQAFLNYLRSMPTGQKQLWV